MNQRNPAEQRQALWLRITNAVDDQVYVPDRLTDADLYGIARLLGVEFEGETSQKSAGRS
jgi:hypothetical protein